VAVVLTPIGEFLENESVKKRIPAEIFELATNRMPWTGYVGFGGDEMIGLCGFKGEPTDEGVVEIAYYTFQEFEGQGFATEMARALIDIASGSDEVQRLIAHTLKEENASTRICKRLGLNFEGEVNDPEDGCVWRWAFDM
jgi:[ribosomal protein S5]-alanine N-acetyltransferase